MLETLLSCGDPVNFIEPWAFTTEGEILHMYWLTDIGEGKTQEKTKLSRRIIESLLLHFSLVLFLQIQSRHCAHNYRSVMG